MAGLVQSPWDVAVRELEDRPREVLEVLSDTTWIPVSSLELFCPQWALTLRGDLATLREAGLVWSASSELVGVCWRRLGAREFAHRDLGERPLELWNNLPSTGWWLRGGLVLQFYPHWAETLASDLAALAEAGLAERHPNDAPEAPIQDARWRQRAETKEELR